MGRKPMPKRVRKKLRAAALANPAVQARAAEMRTPEGRERAREWGRKGAAVRAAKKTALQMLAAPAKRERLAAALQMAADFTHNSGQGSEDCRAPKRHVSPEHRAKLLVNLAKARAGRKNGRLPPETIAKITATKRRQAVSQSYDWSADMNALVREKLDLGWGVSRVASVIGRNEATLRRHVQRHPELFGARPGVFAAPPPVPHQPSTNAEQSGRRPSWWRRLLLALSGKSGLAQLGLMRASKGAD